jgi:SET domain-containing protein
MSGWPDPAAVAESRRRLAMLVDCPYLFVGDAGNRGLGVFTARPIASGAAIVSDEDGSLRQRAVPLATALAQGWDRARELFQLDHDLFLPPRGCFDDLFNHSCEPSGGWYLTDAGARFLAIRDLAAGDELTYDYSCHLLSRDEQMACACETASCRGLIGPFATLPPALRRHYRRLGVVSTAVRRNST